MCQLQKPERKERRGGGDAGRRSKDDSPITHMYFLFYAVYNQQTVYSAAQPMHWIYNPDRLKEVLSDLEPCPEFRPQSANPFYRRTTGEQTCYGDQAYVLLESLSQCGDVNVDDLTKRYYKFFGPGTVYDLPLNDPYRKKGGPKAILPIDGPWRNGSIKAFMRNVDAGKEETDPNSLDAVLAQLNDPKRQNPQELDRAVIALPGAFQGALHGVLKLNQLEEAVRDTMRCGGCTASRSSFIGACFGAQFTEEKFGQAEKTELDAHLENLLVRAETTKHWTEKIMKQTEVLLQPNPNVRLEEFVYEKLEKKAPTRMNNHELLGQSMIESGNEFGPGTAYGNALIKCGETEKQIGGAERELIQSAAINFLTPFRNFLEGDFKTILAEQELRMTQSEFDRQAEITRLLLEGVSSTHAHHLRCLNDFVEAQATYYAQCYQYMVDLQKQLGRAAVTESFPSSFSNNNQSSVSGGASISVPTIPVTASLPSVSGGHGSSTASGGFSELRSSNGSRKARVLYDYDAASSSELSLLADEVITVSSVPGMDSDWLMGVRSPPSICPEHSLTVGAAEAGSWSSRSPCASTAEPLALHAADSASVSAPRVVQSGWLQEKMLCCSERSAPSPPCILLLLLRTPPCLQQEGGVWGTGGAVGGATGSR
ncbi:hypothetical protein L3Q82_004593 [Scortum barcoo]|uniref:Uncharacterized protein n=1 Tax=Scortum barcoo TaxID=214431 RepID=A0ACB8VGM9_9TELE|nr:hypothetical protein L3Q82_004593 [Scortum barcoo]